MKSHIYGQVRLRQAKMRANGQALSRSETVMVMADEAISNATEEIEAKFAELMKNENFEILEYYGRQKEAHEPAKGDIDVTASFGMLVKPAIADNSLAAANSRRRDQSDQPPDEQAEADVAMDGLGVLDFDRIRQVVRGDYPVTYRLRYPSGVKGDSDLIFDLKLRMR